MAAHLHAILRAMLSCRLTLHPGAVPRLTPHMRRPPPPTRNASFFMRARGLAARASKKKDAAAAIGGTPLPAPPGAAVVAAKAGDDVKKADTAAATAAAANMVAATKKGAVVLDPHIPDDMKEPWHVLQLDDEIYDATLNQTNVGANNKKFFIIQALESDDGRSFWVYWRYGRVGSRGRTELLGPMPRHEAIREFKFKFWHKTNNQWSNRKNFRCHSKKYTWLEMDYGRGDKETKKEFVANQETKLETRTAHSVSVIRDISMMKQQMMETGYDADKLPLGKISKCTVLKGYDILKRISSAISKAGTHRIQLEQLSGEFYTVIPHNFGFKKMREFIIDTPEKLKAKLEMVEALGKIEIATRLLEDDSSDSSVKKCGVHMKTLDL